MGRKSNAKDNLSSQQNINHNKDQNSNDGYRKRLRSWKQSKTEFKSIASTDNKDIVVPLQKSTIYTYPIKFNHDRQSIVPNINTRHLDSCTTESVFYCPSISYTSMQTIADLNNNHVTTLNIEEKKRTYQTSSCESFSSRSLPTKTHEILTYHSNLTKRSRFSIDESIITSSLPIDNDTIDINQLDPPEILSSSINNKSSVNQSNSIEAAVKMVQPIVDIIFNAFEDHLKNVPINTNQTCSLSPPSPLVNVPSRRLTSSTHPVVLHAVNFNIQLTTKQNPTEKHITNNIADENDHLQSNILAVFKRTLVNSILSNNSERKRRKLKRLAQLAVFGVSILCGYLLM